MTHKTARIRIDQIQAAIDLLHEAATALEAGVDTRRAPLPDELDGTAVMLREALNNQDTAETVEAECDAWLQEDEHLSLVSPEAWWATKAYLKARGFDWPTE
ncbi:MAG: hypothetical protein AWU57_570 [Marinobacter sp. T13-3]|nr:MAG: hypothetical protein AWU57_570 [Marinobacter sp. T13-3]